MFYDFFKRNLILVTALGSLGVGAVGGTTVYVVAPSKPSFPSGFKVEVKTYKNETGVRYCNLLADRQKGCQMKMYYDEIITFRVNDDDPNTLTISSNDADTTPYSKVTWDALRKGQFYWGFTFRAID